MKTPDPGSLLFLKLDDTAVPALHAGRRYLRAVSPISDARAIAGWVANSADVGEELAADADDTSPTALLQFPVGPLVPAYVVPEELIDTYAKLFSREADADRVINRAIRLRLDAAPPGRKIPHLDPGDLPYIRDGARNYWMKAFTLAALQGPRMLAALLLVQPHELFSVEVARQRAELLLTLRLWS
jgi:hypothetical protein